MRGPWALLLVLWVLAGSAPLRAESPAARDVIRDCSQRAKHDLRGIEALSVECPAVATAIEALGLTAHLPKNWSARVTPGALADWVALTDRYDHPAASARPDSSRLPTIVALLQPPQVPTTWWQEFKAWVANWLNGDHGRWPDWLRWPTQWRPGTPVLYGLIALLLIAAGVVVVRELRAGGVFGEGRRRRAPKRPTADMPPSSPNLPQPAQIDAAAEHLRPELLLRLLVVALTRSNRLEHDRNLTCRELITAARFDTTAQREVFTNVALLAEQILYGDPSGVPLSPDVKLGQSARGLYGELLAAPAGQPGA